MSTKNDANNATTAVTQYDGYAQLANIDFAEMLENELDGLDLSFERIKIPSGGGVVFELPGENSDEPEMVKEFSGVILHHHQVLSFYKDKYTGGSSPPDCCSFDGKTGVGDPGGDCQACPYNVFGSGENNAKACKAKRRIFILREGEVFPLLLSLPTGSLKDFTRHLKRLLGKGKPSHKVVTKFSLKKATNSTGLTYSQAQFAVDRDLTPEEHTQILKWSEQIKEISAKVALDNDAHDSGAADINVDPETGELIAPLTGVDIPPPSEEDYPL